MSSYDRIIKSQNVKIVPYKGKEIPPGEFMKADFIGKENNPAPAESRNFEAEIEKLKQEMEVKFLAAQQDAYKKAFAEGLQEGEKKRTESLVQAKHEFAATIQSLEKVLQETRRLQQESIEGLEKEVIRFAFAVARKIICREVTVNGDVIVNVIRNAIRDIEKRDILKIRLNSTDYAYIHEVSPSFLNGSSTLEAINFEADDGIERGGAVIETVFGYIDACLEEQLQKIEKALQE